MHSPKISALILIPLLGSPIYAAAEPSSARVSQVAAAPTATAADTERALELKVLEKSLKMERKLLEAHKDTVAGQQKNIDWWVSFIGIFMAVVALLGGVIPYFFYRRESESLKEKQNELAELQQKADKQLEQAKELCEQAEQHLSEIINIRQIAEQHADDIEKMKNVTLGTPSTESDADNKAGIQAANELKDNRKIPFIEQLRAKAIVLHNAANSQHNTAAYEHALTAWKSVLLENEDDAQAHFGAAYCQHKLAKLSNDETQKAHYLTEAGKYYQHALAIKQDFSEAANNWSGALLHEAQALAQTGNEQKAHNKRQQALDVLSDFIQKHPEHTAELSYNLACVHALNNQTEQAIQALETCRQSGCLPDKAHIETDKDFDPIRNSEAFQAWFQQAFPENTPN